MAYKEPDMIIHLDLNNLTQAHIEEARPHKGKCSYNSPCIIGALMTPEQREYLEKKGLDRESITSLVESGIATFANCRQAVRARAVQYAFDCEDSATINAAIKAINPELSW
jgi:hypothetical protein